MNLGTSSLVSAIRPMQVAIIFREPLCIDTTVPQSSTLFRISLLSSAAMDGNFQVDFSIALKLLTLSLIFEGVGTI